MNKIIIVLALLVIGCKSTTSVAEKNYQVTPDQVAKHMNFLASDQREGRDTGGEGIAESAAYIENIFSENGVKPYFETYGDTLTNYEQPAYNVVGWVEGNDPQFKDEFVIVGAHYDHSTLR